MFLTKYAPQNTKDIVGNAAAIRSIMGWLHSWTRGVMLVHGPPGCGKTTALRLIAKELGYDMLEVHADEKIPAAELKAATAQRSIFGKKKIILVENIGTASMRGFSDIAKASACPIVCTTDDVYKLSPSVRRAFLSVKFEKISESDMTALAKRIAGEEGIDGKRLGQIARMANGDVRAMLIDIESGSNGYRDFDENMFNTLKLIFKTTSIENARIAMENSQHPDLASWLENNIVEEYTDIEAIATAYDYLSKADVFSARVMRRQSWQMQRYAQDLAVFGTVLAKERPSARFVAYRPPFFRRNNAKLMAKIAVSLHTSATHARDYLPVIKLLGPRFCEELGLDENETDSIMN
ncbi:MAG TPA: AAA family ATPase [archaeon]|nr:AAA family ATPase [archaeon]